VFPFASALIFFLGNLHEWESSGCAVVFAFPLLSGMDSSLNEIHY